MKVSRVSTSRFLIGCGDTGRLELMKSVMDGSKVRGKNQITVPITALSKLKMFEGDEHILYEDDSKKVVERVAYNSALRSKNVAKIKAQYVEKDMPFVYDYKGAYSSIMKHQKTMFNMMKYTNACAILSDPGTGKTGPLLWAIDQKMTEGKVKRCLFITLSGLKDNVLAEVETELPHRDGIVLKNAAHADKLINKKYKVDAKNADYDIYIANYESMFNIVDTFDDYFFDMVILDEVHRCGSPKSRQTKAIVNKFEAAKYKYISSGTLNANDLMSFYMPYRFLGADVVPYANYYTFRGNYMTAVDPEQRMWRPKLGAKEAVSKIIGKSAVLFKKEDCMDLPGVTYTTRYCELEGEQKKVYNQAKKDMVIQIAALSPCEHDGECNEENCTNHEILIDNALILARKLQQIASGFYIDSWTEIDEETGREERKQNIVDFAVNSKMRLLLETIESIPEDRKIIVWASYTHSVEMIMTRLRNKYGDQCIISAYKGQDGFTQVEEFKKPGKRIMVCNTVKMSTGYNIMFSDYQIFFDNTFSYVVRKQAIGRQDRKGQTNKVNVIDIPTRNTIDEHIMNSLDSKEDLDKILGQFSKILQ